LVVTKILPIFVHQIKPNNTMSIQTPQTKQRANYSIRAIHQIPSPQNGYVAVFTAYINGEYCQMWCNCNPNDPAKLEMGYTDTEPTLLGSEVLYINTVFVPLEYRELSFTQLCEIIQYNSSGWGKTDLPTSGVYAPTFNKGERRSFSWKKLLHLSLHFFKRLRTKERNKKVSEIKRLAYYFSNHCKLVKYRIKRLNHYFRVRAKERFFNLFNKTIKL
jgi:hypothetical protein